MYEQLFHCCLEYSLHGLRTRITHTYTHNIIVMYALYYDDILLLSVSFHDTSIISVYTASFINVYDTSIISVYGNNRYVIAVQDNQNTHVHLYTTHRYLFTIESYIYIYIYRYTYISIYLYIEIY